MATLGHKARTFPERVSRAFGSTVRSMGGKLTRSLSPESLFSRLFLGPRFRGHRYTRPWTLENGKPCPLHKLCKHCEAFVGQSRLIRGSRLRLVPSLEYFTLHESVEAFESAVKNQCHLCSLLWAQITQEYDSDISTELSDCPVFIRIKTDEEVGAQELHLIATVAVEPNAKAHEMEWDDWRYGEIPVAELALQINHYGNRGKSYRDYSGNNDYGYMPHASHGEPCTGSAAHMRLIRHWHSDCLARHKLCQKPRVDFAPKRLIKIEDSNVRLYLANVEEACPQYCALSHCWGGATDIMVLTRENLDSLLTGIPVLQLPKTFQDAITVTQAIEVNYLWVDCLCIVQDDGNDWTEQSAMMGSIYENATCTILAASATDAHKGCFYERNPLTYAPCRIAGSGDATLFANDHRLSPYTLEELERPLFRRAWTFQERLLSPRILQFHQFGIEWRCAQGDASEIQPHGSGTRHRDAPAGKSYDTPIFGESAEPEHLSMKLEHYKEAFTRLQRLHVPWDSSPSHGGLEEALTFHKLWFDIVQSYSRCKLTRSTDKLVALSGIAQ